ncbi:glycoside hydrolase family 65 protein [Nocardiopsis eucommiae]|uniref:Glycoside hydrolase family 65 protein n=1 Tax=Nocardiopsis eucommiae TaxID=2831970 RepID=A0A975QLA8_9ACTN|nr:glycoside hydrolase family 65 protein [Nocardiopsis eucommiae]
MDPWTLEYEGPDPQGALVRETLCTLGNGYFATRGAPPEAGAGSTCYPGTYVAGCYDRAVSTVADRRVDNEDLVNVPNWLPLTFRPEDGDWFGEPAAGLPQRTELDMRRGTLTRTFHTVHAGRRTHVTQCRLVSMDDPHLATLRTTLTPENWAGTVVVRSALDGTVSNRGVARYRDLNGRHLAPLGAGSENTGTAWLRCRTLTSGVEIVLASRTLVTRDGRATTCATPTSDDWAATDLTLNVRTGEPTTVEKTVALYTSRDRAVGDCLDAALHALDRAGDFSELARRHEAAWRHLWETCSVEVDSERDQRLLNLHLFHLLQTLSPHTPDLDVGVPARGLHGEAYRGHVFWDEVFVLPFLNLRFPQTARGLLRYRWRRLPRARASARAAGLRGALFPWQSASDGREETQELHLNPRSGHWLPDNSHLQRHVGLAVAYNVWQHYRVTGDVAFLCEFGAELLLEVARAFADMAVFDEELDRFVIRGVMGPDEYHDGYPGRAVPGLDDNAYTNVMTVWVLLRALDILRTLPGPFREELQESLGLEADEIARFESVSRGLHVPFHEGVISQFAHYEDLDELDWEAYQGVRRLDRALEAEGDDCNHYRAAKQADVLMLFLLLSEEEITDILERLGHARDPELVPRTIDHYLARTAHGSSLSSVAHAWVLSRTDREASWEFFRDALGTDVEGAPDGSTAEGIHMGAMAGTVDILTRCYTGLAVREGVLHLSLRLPADLDRLSFDLRCLRQGRVRVEVFRDRVRVSVPASGGPPVTVRVGVHLVSVRPGTACLLPLA